MNGVIWVRLSVLQGGHREMGNSSTGSGWVGGKGGDVFTGLTNIDGMINLTLSPIISIRAIKEDKNTGYYR
jgi:hypothetical protein